jgi:hypothetical protein
MKIGLLEPDSTVADGEVGRQANVGAVNTAGASAALGTGSAPCGRVGGDEEFILGLRYGVKATAGEFERDDGSGHGRAGW